MELLTQKQKERRQRDAKVASIYRPMKEKYPTASQTRIITAMAEQKVCGLTSQYGVRSALINQGVL